MREAFGALGRFTTAHPALAAGFICAVLLLGMGGISQMKMQTDAFTFIRADSPEGILYDAYSETFGTGQIIVAVYADNILEPEVLAYMDRIGSSLLREDDVSGVGGTYAAVYAANGGVEPKNLPEAEMAAARLSPSVEERYLSTRTIGFVQAGLVEGASDETARSLVNTAETIVSLADAPPGVRAEVSGSAAYDIELQEAMQGNMGSLIGLTLVLMVAALWLMFADYRYRLLPVAIVAAGVVCTFGCVGWFRIPVSMPVTGAFPVIIGLGIDYGVQFHARFHEERSRTGTREAARRMLTQSGPVHLVAMVTTALGFLALLTSPIPMIAQFGLVCMIGVICSFVMAILILPVAVSLFGYLKTAPPLDPFGDHTGMSLSLMQRYATFLGRLAVSVARRPVWILLVCACIALVGFQMDSQVGINVDRSSWVPQDMPAKVTLDRVTDALGGTAVMPVYIAGSDVTGPDVLVWMEEFGDYAVQRHEEITRVQSIGGMVAEASGGMMPDSPASAHGAVRSLPPAVTGPYLDGNTASVIVFSTPDLTMDEQRSLVDDLRADLVWFPPPPGIMATPTGMQQVSGDMVEAITVTKDMMTLTGLIMIILFLLCVYRRWQSLAPVIPVVMVLGWNSLIMFLAGIDYTPMTVALGAMTVGIAMDYTILILERCEEELAGGAGLNEAIGMGVSRIGLAITISGVTTILGFSSLLTSDFSIISMFGSATVITILFSLAGAILVMPAVVALMYRKRETGMTAVSGGVHACSGDA